MAAIVQEGDLVYAAWWRGVLVRQRSKKRMEKLQVTFESGVDDVKGDFDLFLHGSEEGGFGVVV